MQDLQEKDQLVSGCEVSAEAALDLVIGDLEKEIPPLASSTSVAGGMARDTCDRMVYCL